MVRIPIYDSDRPLGTGSEFFRPTSEEAARDIQRGLGQLGAGIEEMGNARLAMANRQDKFTSEKSLIDYDQRQSRMIDDQVQKISETGAGFHDRVMAESKKMAEEVLAGIPESQRQQAELRLQQHLSQTSDKLASIEVQQGQKFISTVTKAKVQQITDGLKTGTISLDQGKLEIDNFLTGIDMPKEKVAIFRQSLMKAAEVSRLEYLRTTNPAEFARQAQQFLPNSPSAKAQGIHRLIIEQTKAYGEDPLTALTVASIESSFNPNLGGKGTIRGLMQLTRAERLRIGAKLGLSESQMNDPSAQAAALAILNKEARARLEANGHPVNATTLWGSHLLGQGGMLAFLNSDPNADAFSLYRRVAGPSIASQAFRNNGSLLVPGLTVGQVLTRIDNLVKRKQAGVADLLQANPTMQVSDQGLELMGEKFQTLKPLDLIPNAMDAQAEVVKRSNAVLTDQVRKSALLGGDGSESGNPYDAAWRKSMDEAAKLDNAQARILSNDADAIAKYTAFADRHGYLPKEASAAVLQLINSKDRSLQYRGYEMAARIVRANPTDGLRLSTLGGDTDDQGANNAAKIRDYTNLTVHGGFGNDDAGRLEALRRVELRHSPDYKFREADLKNTLEKEVKARNWAEIEKGLGVGATGMLWWGKEGSGPPTKPLRDRMEEKYQEFYRFHRLNGDLPSIASANALADLNRSTNHTKLFGDKSYMMPYPPEYNYPPATPLPMVGDRTKTVGELTKEERTARYGYITDQALEIVKEHARRNGNKNADKLSAADIVLLPDGNTKRDVESRALPRYTLAYKVNGEWMPILREFRANPEMGRGQQTEYGDPTDSAARTRNVPPSAEQQNARDKFRSGRSNLGGPMTGPDMSRSADDNLAVEPSDTPNNEYRFTKGNMRGGTVIQEDVDRHNLDGMDDAELAELGVKRVQHPRKRKK